MGHVEGMAARNAAATDGSAMGPISDSATARRLGIPGRARAWMKRVVERLAPIGYEDETGFRIGCAATHRGDSESLGNRADSLWGEPNEAV